MATTVEYVVYRHGSNGANQSMTEVMPVGIYSGAGKTASERRAQAIAAAALEHTTYANQWLDAVPTSRVSAEERELAWEHQMTAREADEADYGSAWPEREFRPR